MPDHHRAGLDDLGVGLTDAPGDVFIELVRDPPPNVIGLKALERVGHHS